MSIKIILLFVIALCIASGMAYLIHIDPGFVLLTYDVWSLETSLAVFLFVLLVSFLALYLALRTAFTVKRMPGAISHWSSERKQKKARIELTKGLLDSAEGDWQRSEKRLIKHAVQSETPLLNYLSAAHAAQSLGAYERRDAYLLKAGEVVPSHAKTIHLTRAKLQFGAGQYEQALASVRQLVDTSPKHPIALKLLMQVYAKLNDWESLYKLLPNIKNNDKIRTEDWRPLEKRTLLNLLSRPTNLSLDTIWNSLDKLQKADPEYLALYVLQKIKKGESRAILDPLLKVIKLKQHPRLVALYAQLDIDANQKIKQMDKWLQHQPNNIGLLNALGQLYLEQKLWGKAQQTLQHSVDIQASSTSYLLLGRLQQAQGDSSNKASGFYRLGLELAEKNALTTTEP